MTDSGTKTDFRKAMDGGADDYLIKPFYNRRIADSDRTSTAKPNRSLRLLRNQIPASFQVGGNSDRKS